MTLKYCCSFFVLNLVIVTTYIGLTIDFCPGPLIILPTYIYICIYIHVMANLLYSTRTEFPIINLPNLQTFVRYFTETLLRSE